MINVLLTTLTDYLMTRKDHSTGNADINNLRETKKRFTKALYELIDYRIQLALEERRRLQSQERIAAADSINLAVKSTASTIKSLSALNSAPPPPDNIANIEEMEHWKRMYQEWYDTKRKSGITIG
jgi:hypothetical protein